MNIRGLFTTTNLILIATILASSVVLRAQLEVPMSSQHRQSDSVEQPATLDQQPPSLAAHPISFYREIATRPLFTQARRPPVARVAAPVPATPRAPKIEIELLGVVFTPGSKLAVIKDLKTGHPRSVKEGEVYNGWTVNRVEANQIRLTYADQSKIYRIFHSDIDQNTKTPSSPTASSNSARGSIDVLRQNSSKKPLDDRP